VSVDYLSKYKINHKELELGNYQYQFSIDDKFFESFEKSEIQSGELEAKVDLTKESRVITLDISIQGTVKVQCDRCLDFFDFKIDYNGKLYVKHEGTADSEDVIIVLSDEPDINLAQYFYESIHLTLPLKRIHPDDEDGNSTCNQDMLDLLEQYKQEDKDKTDPRWDKLKNLFVKRN